MKAQRNTSEITKLKDDEVYISAVLTDIEIGSFISVYSELSPERKGKLASIAKSAEWKERHPLFIGLSAFEKGFTGLKEFVEKAYQSGSEIQNRLVAYIALCGVYAQRSLSAQVFSGLLMVHESSVIRLKQYLTPELLYLIVNDIDLDWRPLHYLVGEEFLAQYLGAQVNIQLLKHGLADLAVDFVDMLAKRSFIPSKLEMDLVGKLFIDRNCRFLRMFTHHS